ncbi:MAG: transcriptional repressor NrdR [Gemmatimonadetes bacterium]|nr:transcriptional repressor NrdR [Gemmatimonadota bacterium]NIQ54769.1 transcriptional repressor NrdR [Gemmatimonadota bacterium]NIU74978.1 transcriptional repressor NrdR [Gammaproteobacteria bacterium]NIX44851.1 transcriptional repressor NrdR [Gemmatimonadota bacterium]NIY09089.1 transcriptional repressor NrdR [Gemmatimonadota bacterium]
MRCPYCHETEDRVVDSRTSREGRAIRRRRECLSCARRFTTYEEIEERPVQVIKSDGTVESFDREKLLRSIRLPCVKRPVTEAEIEAMVDAIEDELSSRDQIPSRELGELVMAQLRERDYVAYVRFASVYRNFQDIDEFVEELEDLNEARARLEQQKNQEELPL